MSVRAPDAVPSKKVTFARDGTRRSWFPANLDDLGPRVASAVVMIALALAALYTGGNFFAVFWLVAAIAIYWEWQRMVGGTRPLPRFVFGSLVLVVATALARNHAPDVAIEVLVAGAIVIALMTDARHRWWSAAGLIYAGALVICVCVLRFSIFYGLEAVAWLFALVWGTDVMAYFGGRIIRGPKLWPRLSPSKTWAGSISGVACGALLALVALTLVNGQTGAMQIEPLPIFALGVVGSIVAQSGDLFESWVKRHFHVKDASQLIPGHGGFMDRLDGFIFAVTFAAILGALRAGPLAAAHGLFLW